MDFKQYITETDMSYDAYCSLDEAGREEVIQVFKGWLAKQHANDAPGGRELADGRLCYGGLCTECGVAEGCPARPRDAYGLPEGWVPGEEV